MLAEKIKFNRIYMSKKIWALIVVISMIISLYGCHKKGEKGGVKGVVTSVDASLQGDSIRSMKVLVNGDDTLIFNMRTTGYANELMFPKDSVIVMYIDDLNGDTLRATEVSVIPKPGRVVSLDSMKHNKLITR